MAINIIPISNLNIRDNGLIHIDLATLALPIDFHNVCQYFIQIPPLKYGGNHTHPRREIFFSLDDVLELQWIDKEGVKNKRKMREKNHFYLFDIPPFVPHAIVNTSSNMYANLIEFANHEQYGVVPCIVYDLIFHH